MCLSTKNPQETWKRKPSFNLILHSSSSSSPSFADSVALEVNLSPNGPACAACESLSVEVPRTSLIRPEDSAIRRRRAFSSAVETLARCFFSGLPKNPSGPLMVGTGCSGAAELGVAFGGVVDRSVTGGVVPEAGVSVDSAPLPLKGSAEC